MDRAVSAAVAKPPHTPRTADSTFTITALDVGSPAVRPGCMAEIEGERNLLLAACKVALNRMQDRSPAGMDAIAEFTLESAIRMAEIGKSG